MVPHKVLHRQQHAPQKSDCHLQLMLNNSKLSLEVIVLHSQTFRLTAEGLESMAAFIGQGLPMMPFDRPFTAHHSSFCSASRFGAWKCRHNDRPVCKLDSFLLSWGGLASQHLCFQAERKRLRYTRLPEILYNSTNPMMTSTFVCHMHQTDSQHSMGMMSEAETYQVIV